MSKETTPIRRHIAARNSDKTPLKSINCNENDTHNKYKATTLWNSIIRHFREEMPVKRHRRQLTYFEDSFTGKEAADFLMVLLPRLLFEGRQVDRSNCITLLQKFLDQGFIRRIRSNPSEKDTFKDNATLYVITPLRLKNDGPKGCLRFVDDCTLLGITRTPRLLRTNSCSEDRRRAANTDAKLRSVHQRKSPDQFQFLKIETPICSKGFNRRMSSSHGNLLSLVPTHKDFDSADSLAETIDSRIVEVNFNLRPSPLKEYNTPKIVSTDVKQKGNSRKISKIELKKSPTLNTQNVANVANSVAKENETACKESAYEWLTFVRRKKSHAVINKLPLNQRSSSFNKGEEDSAGLLRHRKNPGEAIVKSKDSEIQYAPLKVTHRCITEIDSWSIWKNCLLARSPISNDEVIGDDHYCFICVLLPCFLEHFRLRRILAVSTLPFITWEVLGQDVKWNCQRIGISGIVKLRIDREDFSSYLMRLMRYLEQFPFPSGSANIITYKDNQEVNVFRTVCSHLSREQPMLTDAQAFALIHVISLYHPNVKSDLSHQTYDCSVHIETEFTEEAPRSRIVPRRPSSNSIPSPTDSSRSSFTESLEHCSLNRGVEFAEKLVTTLDSQGITSRDAGSLIGTFAERSRFGQGRRNTCLLEGLPEYNEVLKLPGLKESPELMKRLDEMCLKPLSSSQLISQVCSEFMKLPEFNELICADRQCPISDLSRLSSRSIHLVSTAATEFSEDPLPRPPNLLLEALSLVLLSLPTSRRRRLHYLIRFMNKISANHCLQLDQEHSNRYAVLKGLSGSIASTEGSSLSAAQRAHLVSLLLDYEKEIFSVPKNFVLEVNGAIRERQREKVTPVGQSSTIRSQMSSYVQFCEAVKESEYNDQNLNLVGNLLELLDQICSDENLTLQEKRKRLKKFKKTYPSVYSQRFPSPELTIPKKKERENRFLLKLFGR